MSLSDSQFVTDIVDFLLCTPSAATDTAALGTLLDEGAALAVDLKVAFPATPGMELWQRIAGFKSNLEDRLTDISQMCVAAANGGFLLPTDPSPTLESLNESRMLFHPISDPPEGLADDIRKLNAAALDWKAGTVSFDRPAPSGQISSFEVSVDGISQQSGDPLADILGYQPDGDFVKRKRAIDALSRLDFSKRQPYLLFTADLLAGGRRNGNTIVCWQRMRDASGYAIRKRDVFGMQDFPDIVVTAADADSSTRALAADSRFQQLLTFYDWIGPGDYVAMVDQISPSDTVLRYEVLGIQVRAPSTPVMFDVPRVPLHLSMLQLQQLRSQVQAEADRFSADFNSISPYPALAGLVLGDPSLGWVMAGCNALVSQQRGDPPSMTRSLMFIGSTIEGIIGLISSGSIVVPTDVAAIQTAVESAISSYGVSQAMLSVLDGIGITEYVAGKDDPLGLQSTKEALDRSTGGLARILSAIDPDSATVDPQVILTNLSAKQTDVRTSATVLIPATIIPPPPVAPSPIDAIGSTVMDLTTFEGIGRFVTAIRALYDYFPGMVS